MAGLSASDCSRYFRCSLSRGPSQPDLQKETPGLWQEHGRGDQHMSDTDTSNGLSAPRKVEAIRSKRISLGHGYAVRFSYLGGALLVDWKPSMPTGANRVQVLPAYVRERDSFLAGAVAQTGASLAVTNPDGSVSVFGAWRP
jgi:hypothetical protein